MKLFVIAAMIAVASAARLEHLERGYLPPDQGSRGSFGSQGSLSHQGSFGSQFGGSFGSGFESNSLDIGSRSSLNPAFPGATLNQYLPPDHGPSGSNGFSGSLSGFNARSQYTPQSFGPQPQFGSQQQYGSASQFGAPQPRLGGPLGGSQPRFGGSIGGSQSGFSGSLGGSQSGFGGSFGGSRYSQLPSASRQYLAPRPSFQSIPQQAFDEQTGYHY